MESAEQKTELSIREISREELREKMKRGAPFLLVETLPAAYFRHSHLPGAINTPLDGIPFQTRKILPDASTEIVVYCFDEKCPAAANAAQMLRNMGYENVREYHGGKADWRAAGLPLEGESRALRKAL
jgi:rhodanese-related sulfurtransferase